MSVAREAQGFLQNLVHKGRNAGFERRVGFFALHVEDNLLADLRPAPVFPQLLDRLRAEPEVLLDDRMDRAGRGEHDLEAFAQEEAQVALLHLARRLAEGKGQAVFLDAQRQQVVVKDELDGHQLQGFALEVQGDGINKLQLVGGGQSAPGVFLGGEVEIHNRAMLWQVEPPLPAPDLLKLLLGELALFQQEVADLFARCVLILLH